MNVVCSSCKTENPSIASFCSNCGYNLRQFTELTDLELLRNKLAPQDYKVDRKVSESGNHSDHLGEYIPTGEKIIIRLLKKDQPDDLKKMLDSQAKQEKTKRSTLIQKAVRIYLQLRKRQQVKDLLAEGYQAMAVDAKDLVNDFEKLDHESLKYLD